MSPFSRELLGTPHATAEFPSESGEGFGEPDRNAGPRGLALTHRQSVSPLPELPAKTRAQQETRTPSTSCLRKQGPAVPPNGHGVLHGGELPSTWCRGSVYILFCLQVWSVQTSDKLSFASFFVQVGTVTQILMPADLKTGAFGGLVGMRPTSSCRTGGGYPLSLIACLNDHKKANSFAVDFF